MKHSHLSLWAACLLIAPLFALQAGAYMQPTVNLGFTSFLDGGPPAGPGFYFAEYVQYYSSDKLVDGPPNSKVNVWASLNQFLYQSDKKVFFGGKWGLDVIVPIVSIDAESAFLTDNGTGVGDVLVGPYLQWDPVMGKNGPVFMHRIELQTIFPTGKYDNTKALNPGSNFYSFDPYWSGTYFLTPKLTASWRLHDLWNGKNNDPAGAADSQAGQAFHANFAAEYEVKPKQLRVGINGYYFKQLTDSEVDGTKVNDKEQVLGIGPGMLWSFSQNTHLFFNAYIETGAEYRPEGQKFVTRLVHHF
jgi:hypothetical protein